MNKTCQPFVVSKRPYRFADPRCCVLALLAILNLSRHVTPCLADISEASIEAMTERLAAAPADALPEADRLFETLLESRADSTGWHAFHMRLTALRALRERITSQFRQNVRREMDRTILDLVESDSPPPRPQHAPESESIVSAEQLYRLYAPHFRFAIDTSSLSTVEKEFLHVYYSSHVRAMIDEIMFLGRPLQAVLQENHELEYHLLLLPLLHSAGDFDVELLKNLPPLILTTDRLARLSDFCLFRAGRLDAAEAIALRLRGAQATDAARFDFYIDAARRSRDVGRPTLSVECMRRAIACLDPDDPEVVARRFEMCQTWRDAENFALAADEAGAIAHDFPGTEHAGRARYLRITYLVEADAYRTALKEIDAAMEDPLCADYRNEMLYRRWKCFRKEGMVHEANTALRSFLNTYPDDPYGAEMYFAVGVDCLATQRYSEAQSVFQVLVDRYPDSWWSQRTKPLLEKIAALDDGAAMAGDGSPKMDLPRP